LLNSFLIWIRKTTTASDTNSRNHGSWRKPGHAWAWLHQQTKWFAFDPCTLREFGFYVLVHHFLKFVCTWVNVNISIYLNCIN
jgi:hypothetical protein